MQKKPSSWDFETLEKLAMEKWKNMQEFMNRCVEAEDASHDQEIKGYLFRAVTDIARKCGVSESEVWAEVEYWSRDKG